MTEIKQPAKPPRKRSNKATPNPSAVELKEGRNEPALAGVSGKPTGRMPETVVAPPYSGLHPNLNSTVLTPSPQGDAAIGAQDISGQSGRTDQTDANDAPLAGEYLGKEDGPAAQQALTSVLVELGPDEDEAVVQRVEHLPRSVGWVLISAGVVGLIVPGVIGTPFLIMGGLALWPGNHKKAERWRQGHSPKVFHGAMRQINRFLDDLEKRYPRIDKQ